MIRAALLLLVLLTSPAWAETRIVVFGDSLTAGFGLPKADGLVPRLQRWLDGRNADVRLIERGLSGDTTYGGRVRIAWALRGGADAVIVELGANDMLLRMTPEAAGRNLQAILDQTGARPVLLVGIVPPDAVPGADDALRQRWTAMWRNLAEQNDALLLPDMIARIMAEPDDVRRRAYFQRDHLHLSRAGLDLLIQDLGPLTLELAQRATPKD